MGITFPGKKSVRCKRNTFTPLCQCLNNTVTSVSDVRLFSHWIVGIRAEVGVYTHAYVRDARSYRIGAPASGARLSSNIVNSTSLNMIVSVTTFGAVSYVFFVTRFFRHDSMKINKFVVSLSSNDKSSLKWCAVSAVIGVYCWILPKF